MTSGPPHKPLFGSHTPTARQVLQYLNARLGFQDDSGRDQEWGFLNANKLRIGEYLDVYWEMQQEHKDVLRDLIELILYSYGQMLASPPVRDDIAARMTEFVRHCRSHTHRDAFRTVLLERESDQADLRVWLETLTRSLGGSVAWYLED